MFAYDPTLGEQPAPVAFVELHNPASGAVATSVKMLIDTGADVSLIPRSALATLNISAADSKRSFLISGFDASESALSVVILRMRFLNKDFKGLFLLSEAEYGIIGRNILRNVCLHFDGPRQVWGEIK